MQKNDRKKKIKIKYRKSEVISGYLFILPSAVLFFTFMIIPIFMGFYISMTNYDGFKTMDFIGIKNYADMFKDSYFTISFKNNVIYALTTVPGTIVLSLLLAVAVNKGLRGSGFFKTVFFFPYITSNVAVGIIWSLLFNPNNGPINNLLRGIGISSPPDWLLSTKWALPAIIVVSIWKSAGYYMIIFLAGLQAISKELYEAADVDGAGGLTKFFKITLPLLSPTTFLVVILMTISSFQVFDLINVMTEGGPGRATNVLVYRIYQEGFKYMHFGYASAMAYFLFFVILIITIIQFIGQKKWVTYQ